MESWCILLHIMAALGWDVQQIDIKTAFLYGLLPEDEVQFMEQPEGFLELGKGDLGLEAPAWAIWDETSQVHMEQDDE